jgi:hypothetical protein
MSKSLQSDWNFKQEKANFLFQNKDLSQPDCNASVDVIENPEGYLSVIIILNWDSAYEDLKKAISTAQIWQSRLNYWQKQIVTPLYQIKLNVLLHKDHGESYTTIAQRYNREIENSLCKYVTFARRAEKTKATTINDLYDWYLNFPKSHRGSFFLRSFRFSQICGADNANRILEAFSFNRGDRKAFVNDTISQMREGKWISDRTYPIDQEKVRHIVRYRKKSMQGGIFTEPPKRLSPNFKEAPFMYSITGYSEKPAQWNQENLWKPEIE